MEFHIVYTEHIVYSCDEDKSINAIPLLRKFLWKWVPKFRTSAKLQWTLFHQDNYDNFSTKNILFSRFKCI